MTDDHNPWKNDGTAPPAEDIEDVEAERVQTFDELEGRPLGEQLEALSGTNVPSLSIGEMDAILRAAKWYAARCREIGVEPPADVLRGVACLAHETLSYNIALAEQGHPDARPPGSTITKH